MKTLAAVVVVAVGLVQNPMPQRDAPIVPTTGTASISGVVVNDETPARPVRRAIVTLAGADLRPSRGAITDDEGRFTLTGLPAGRFTLTVARASFITSAYGAKRPGRPGTAVAVADSQQVRDLVVRIWRGAAIAGVLRDDMGAPVDGIAITAVPVRSKGATLTLSNNGVLTNELGEYRIFGLEPGAYIVMARLGASGGAPLRAATEADVDAALAALRRGTISVGNPQTPAASTNLTSTASAPPAAAKPFDYAPVFFPGTPVATHATTVQLTSGQELTGVDFAIQKVSTAVVEGRITRPDGQSLAGTTVRLTAAAAPGIAALIPPVVLNATAGPDGQFRFASVIPGDYRLIARALVQPAAPEPGYSTPAATPSLWAAADLRVAGEDMQSLALAVEPGATVSGRVQAAPGATSPTPDFSQLRVELRLPALDGASGSTPTPLTFAPPVAVQKDGTFAIANVAPDTYRLRVFPPASAGSTWWPRSAMLGDRDLLDGQIEVTRSTNLTGVVVTLSDRPSELAGALQAADGAPASDVFVIAFATERRHWGPGTRRVRAVRPDADGRYSVPLLPPGDYFVAAVTDADPDDWQDPAFLEQLQPAAIKIAIGEGERRIQNLRIGSR